jgi:hypothetical protein
VSDDSGREVEVKEDDSKNLDNIIPVWGNLPLALVEFYFTLNSLLIYY